MTERKPFWRMFRRVMGGPKRLQEREDFFDLCRHDHFGFCSTAAASRCGRRAGVGFLLDPVPFNNSRFMASRVASNFATGLQEIQSAFPPPKGVRLSE